MFGNIQDTCRAFLGFLLGLLVFDFFKPNFHYTLKSELSKPTQSLISAHTKLINVVLTGVLAETHRFSSADLSF